MALIKLVLNHGLNLRQSMIAASPITKAGRRTLRAKEAAGARAPANLTKNKKAQRIQPPFNV